MQTDRQAGKMLVSMPTGLSVQNAIDVFHDGQREVRKRLSEIATLSAALDQLGAAIQTVQTDKSAPEQQALVTAGREVSSLLYGDRPTIESDNRDFCAEARIARGMLTAPTLPSLAQMMGAA